MKEAFGSGKLCCVASKGWEDEKKKLLPHSRLKTNYSDDNEKLMATVRNVHAALKRRGK